MPGRRGEPVSPELIERYREIQREMADQVVERPLAAEPKLAAALDVHFAGQSPIAVAVACQVPSLDVVEEKVVVWAAGDDDDRLNRDITSGAAKSGIRSIVTGTELFPYIPGLLSFREAPICVSAFERLDRRPDLLLVDGHGRAHPRRFGIACHLGVELQLPTIGVAKSILVGRHGPLDEERGSTTPLVDRGEVVGMIVRTRDGVSPVYVTVGNLITLDEAVEWTLRLTRGYRLPEPSRRAHRVAQQTAADLRR